MNLLYLHIYNLYIYIYNKYIIYIYIYIYINICIMYDLDMVKKHIFNILYKYISIYN